MYKNVLTYINIFLNFYVYCLELSQSKRIPQENVKRDEQQNELIFMFNQYPFLLLQNIHSIIVGVCNSFIQEEIQLQF